MRYELDSYTQKGGSFQSSNVKKKLVDTNAKLKQNDESSELSTIANYAKTESPRSASPESALTWSMACCLHILLCLIRTSEHKMYTYQSTCFIYDINRPISIKFDAQNYKYLINFM